MALKPSKNPKTPNFKFPVFFSTQKLQKESDKKVHPGPS